MRPIKRGSTPTNKKTGKEIKFQPYQKAKKYLTDRLGKFCSYCEIKDEINLAVEHIQPKGNLHTKHLQCSWDNFLLACSVCNSKKGKAEINQENIDDYLWPDRDNTFRAIVYGEGGTPEPNSELDPKIQNKAKALISLVGLDRNPANGVELSDCAPRWESRFETWYTAVQVKNALNKCQDDETRKTIYELSPALITQYFSIWTTVFTDDPDMLQIIFAQFKGKVEGCGTALDCFDEKTFKPKPRPGGRC